MKKLLLRILLIQFGLIITTTSCLAQKQLMRDSPIKLDRIYDHDFYYGIKKDNETFQLCVFYKKYQPLSNLQHLVDVCKSKFHAILQNYSDSIKIKMVINDHELEYKTKHDYWVGNNSCLVCGKFNFNTFKESDDVNINNVNGNEKKNKSDARKELIDLKELLDMGIITQEEYDKKAKNLKKIILE